MKKRAIFVIMLLALLFSRQVSAWEFWPEDEKDQKHYKDYRRHAPHTFLAKSNLFEARFILEMKDRINLTKKQQEKIEDLMLEHQASVIQDSAEIKVKELQFVTYLKSGEMERKQVEKFIREVSEKKTDVIVHHLNHLLDIRAGLTPDQIQKLVEIQKKKYSRSNCSPKKQAEKH